MQSVATEQEARQHLYQLLTKLFNLMDDADRRFFGEFGLSTRQFWALHHLEQNDRMSMVELSRRLLTDKSNVTAIIDRLEEAGYVTRTPAPQDRRVILLSLTPAGVRRHDDVWAAHHERISELLVGDAAALHATIATLDPIREHIESFLQATPTAPKSDDVA